jgi:hypothetical protein
LEGDRLIVSWNRRPSAREGILYHALSTSPKVPKSPENVESDIRLPLLSVMDFSGSFLIGGTKESH